MADLSTKIGSVTLKNPVLTASGCFGYGDEVSGILDVNRLGGLVTKSITVRSRLGNRPPRTCETPAGMINSIGLANVGLDRFVTEKLPLYTELDTRIIVNVAGDTLEDYCRVVEGIDAAGGHIDGYEINISCPNTDQGGIFFGEDAAQCFRVMQAVRQRTRKLLIAKLTPNVTDVAPIAQAAADAGADCVSMINSMVGMAINPITRKPRIASIMGGLTGPCIRPIAIAQVFEVAAAVDIPIIGIGGIGTHLDALEFILAGASAIQVGTANFYDPLASVKIVEALAAFLDERGIARITDLIGAVEY